MSGEPIAVQVVERVRHPDHSYVPAVRTMDLLPGSLSEAKMRVAEAAIELEAARDEYAAVITEEQYDAALARKAKAKRDLADAFSLYRRALTKGETDG